MAADPAGAIPLRDDPTIRAEMATLGAMLIGPELIARAGDLSPADFRSPIHAALAAVILDAAGAGTAPRRPPPRPGQPAGHPAALGRWTTKWLHDTVWARARHHPDMKGLAPDYLLQLIAASPHPARIGWYAQIVREQAARTRIAALAVHHAATLAEPMTISRLHTALARASTEIGTAADHLTPPKELDRDTRLLPTHPEDGDLEPLLPRLPPPAGVAATEDQLLGVLLADNRLIDPVARIVDSADFHAPGRNLLFRLTDDMHRHGIPVDPVTIARPADWLKALSTSRNGDGRLTLDQLFQLPQPADKARAVELARQVQSHGIRLNLRSHLRHLVNTANHADVPARAVHSEAAAAVQTIAGMRARLTAAGELQPQVTTAGPHLGR